MLVTKECPVCGNERSMVVVDSEYERWQNGELVQNVFRYLSPSDREFLISGVCSDECWIDLYEDE